MDYSIIYKGGELIASRAIPLYQNENNGNKFKFCIDMRSLESFTPSGIQVLFFYKYPGDNVFNYTDIPLDAEVYKERYLKGELPITDTYTKFEGSLVCYLQFKEVDPSGISLDITTNELNVRIVRSNYQAKGGGATKEDIEKLQKQISDLMNAKAGEFEIEGNRIYVYSDATKTNLIDTVDIPEEVSYEFGEG